MPAKRVTKAGSAARPADTPSLKKTTPERTAFMEKKGEAGSGDPTLRRSSRIASREQSDTVTPTKDRSEEKENKGESQAAIQVNATDAVKQKPTKRLSWFDMVSFRNRDGEEGTEPLKDQDSEEEEKTVEERKRPLTCNEAAGLSLKKKRRL